MRRFAPGSFPASRHASDRFNVGWLLVLGLLLLTGGCGDEELGTGPGGPNGLSGFRLEAAPWVAAGAPFVVTVTALGPDGQQTHTAFSGAVALSTSAGTLSPGTLTLSQGVGTAEVVLGGANGVVTLRASAAGANGSASLEVRTSTDRLLGAPGAPAAGAIPRIPFTARPDDYTDTHPDLPGAFLSFNTLLVLFELDVTVGQVNALLDAVDAAIVGGIPGVPGSAQGILFLRLPTTTHEGMTAALATLRASEHVSAAGQDVLLEPAGISEDNGGTPADWTWTATPGGGNWGLELIRVPQMWNLRAAIDKQIPPTRLTGVIDIGFTDPSEHPDLKYHKHLSPGDRHDHGAHVAGIIGATFNAGSSKTGIDGINPFAKLVVQATQTKVTGASQLDWAISWGQGLVAELDSMLRSQADLRVLNLSLKYPWKPPEVNTSTNVAAQDLARAHGTLHKALLDLLEVGGTTLPLMVTAAGNESAGQPQEAKYGSPMNYAALVLGASSTIVVEALDHSAGSTGGATRRPSSNHHGHVSAPGGEIMSTVLSPTLYKKSSGTSMAAPHVAGLAGYLLAIDPALTTAQLRELLLGNTIAVAGGASPRIDAYAAVLDIDRLKGDTDVLRMLVDIDDGTEDGNRRTDPDADFADYTEADADEDGGIGDGDVDMSDFRRWRDGYLALAYAGITDAIELDGSDSHAKKDLNGNGKTESEGDDESVYPFVDLNGDNLTDNSPADVPGLGKVTDLAMLEELFEDPHYAKTDLSGLLFSADIAIRPAKLLDKGEAVDIHSSLRPADATEAEDHPKFRRIHTGDAASGEGLWQVYTVPAYQSDGTTEQTWTARVVGLDAAGDTIFDAETSFTTKPGQDHFWDPGCQVHEGGLLLRTQADVDAAGGICEVSGELVISEIAGTTDPITTLQPLHELQRAAGLWVGGTTQLADMTGLGALVLSQATRGLNIIDNQALTSLSGLALAAPGSTQSMTVVQIQSNPVLVDISAASNLIGPGPVDVATQITVWQNPLLASLAGLEALRSAGESVYITENAALASLDGLAGLEEVAGRITIEQNGLTSLSFPSLRRIQGDLDILSNAQLTTVDVTIDSVGKASSNGIRIASNNATTSVKVSVAKGIPEFRIQFLPALTTLDVHVGSGEAGLVSVTHTGLTTITRFDPVRVIDDPGSIGGFYLYENPNLADMNAFQNLQSVDAYFMVRDNPGLCLPDWLYDISVGASRVIRNNKDPGECGG